MLIEPAEWLLSIHLDTLVELYRLLELVLLVEPAKLVLLPELDTLGELVELVMLIELTELARLDTTECDVVAVILPVTNNLFMIIV